MDRLDQVGLDVQQQDAGQLPASEGEQGRLAAGELGHDGRARITPVVQDSAGHPGCAHDQYAFPDVDLTRSVRSQHGKQPVKAAAGAGSYELLGHVLMTSEVRWGWLAAAGVLHLLPGAMS